MKLPNVSMSFVWIVFTCGFVGLLAIIGNLTILGLKRPTIPNITEINWEDHQRGRLLLSQYGCGGCHVVPGLSQAKGRVGPSLEHLHEQMFIAGVVANESKNLALWIQQPDVLAPGTAMPNLGVTSEESLIMANYLLNASRKSVPEWLQALIIENKDQVKRP